MLPSRKIFGFQVGSPFFPLALSLALGVGAFPQTWAAGLAQGTLSAKQGLTSHDNDIVDIRAVARGGRVAVGPRGGAVARRTTVVRPGFHGGGTRVVRPAVRPGYHGGGVRWARPGWYHWPRGGAIAAGAAVGFVTAATAAAWAGAAPAPGMCWYYTDASRTQGFWDYCP